MAFMASFIAMLCLCSAVAEPTETCGSTSDDTSLLQKKTKVSKEILMSMQSSKAAPYVEYSNFCVSSANVDLVQTADATGNANKEACAGRCDASSSCSAYEWYENGWTVPAGSNMKCFLMLGSTPATKGSSQQWRDAKCYVKPTCTDKCSFLGHMNNNPNTGSDQIISCSQACMIVSRGSSKTECESNCNRNGQSGCSLNVNGYSYSMCAAREDYSHEALVKLVTNDACRDGCSMGASTEPSAACDDFSTKDACPENCLWMDGFGCKDPNGTVEDLEGLNDVSTTSMMSD